MRAGPRAFVDSWLARRSRTASAPLLAQEALEAVWARARRSLSESALQALSRTALDKAAGEFPVLAGASVGARGFELGAFAQAESAELLPALGGLLAELLTLVEDTSGAILAPALEAELLRVGSRGRTPPFGTKAYVPE